MAQEAAKRVGGHRSRKGSNGKPCSTLHNGRNFNVDKAKHIDPNAVKDNVYWVLKNGALERVVEEKSDGEKAENPTYNFDEFEQEYYTENFSEQLEVRNEKQIAARHKNRVQTMEQFRGNAKFCPEEIILTIGNRDNKVSPETMQRFFEDYVAWHNQNYPCAKIIDGALHLDEPEASPHIHARQVWYTETLGYKEIGQEKALAEMGIKPPREDKPIGRKNNAKMTYTAQCRDKMIELAKSYGIEIIEEPKKASEVGLELLEFKKKTLEKDIANLESKIEKNELKNQQVEAQNTVLTDKCSELSREARRQMIAADEAEERQRIAEQNAAEAEQRKTAADEGAIEAEQRRSEATAQVETLTVEVSDLQMQKLAAAEIPPCPIIEPLPDKPSKKEQRKYDNQVAAVEEWHKTYGMSEKAAKFYAQKGQIEAKQNAKEQQLRERAEQLNRQTQLLEERHKAKSEKLAEVEAALQAKEAEIAKEKAAVEAEKRSIPQRIAEGIRKQAEKIGFMQQWMSVSDSFKRKFSAMFGEDTYKRVYESEGKDNGNKAFKNVQER